MAENNGWSEHKLLVLESLERLEEMCKEIKESQVTMNNEFIALKTEGRVAKYFGGGVVLPAVVAIGVSWVGRKLGL